MPKLAQAAFAVACFLGLSGIYTQMIWWSLNGSIALPLTSTETASCNSPHDLLMSLAMDLAALCDMWR